MDKLNLLRTWAVLGRTIGHTYRRSFPTWIPALRLIEAVQGKLALEATKLQSLLEESRRRLSPLEDPFDLDLGVHRWLDGEREEVYSDWLHWVLLQLKSPARLLRVFDIVPPAAFARWHDLTPDIFREFWVPVGHAGRTGRLDLLIRYGTQALIVIEVKIVGAEAADTLKGAGYRESLDQEQAEHKWPILLATAADKETYPGGFRFVSWANVCIELRRAAIDLSKERRVTVSAMILAFVAAVEQNLLSFSVLNVQTTEGQGSLVNTSVVDHLARYLGQER